MLEISNFTIQSKIGTGATSDVYLALDSMGQKRALKVFHTNYFADNSQTFRRELDHLAQLRSEKIVSLFGETTCNNGQLVLIQEFIQGSTLRTILERKIPMHLRIPLALYIGNEILMALEVAHQKGIIHRDIKPENILIEDKTFRVVLSDFGLSKDINLNQQTVIGSIFGTPQYMSLQQFNQEFPTPFFDLYAVAVLLYEIITGKPPFKGDSLDKMLDAKKNGNVLPIYKSNYFINRELENLIIELLIKPHNEIEQAFEFKYHLQNITKSHHQLSLSEYRLLLQERYEEIAITEDQISAVLVKSLEQQIKSKSVSEQDRYRITEQLLLLGTEAKTPFQKSKRKKIFFTLLVTICGALILALTYLNNFPNQKIKSEPTTEEVTAVSSTPVPLITPTSTPTVEPTVISTPTQTTTPIAEPTVIPTTNTTTPKVGFIVLNIPKELAVIIDNKVVAERNVPIKFKVGKHNITIIKAGTPPIQSTILVNENQESIINVQ